MKSIHAVFVFFAPFALALGFVSAASAQIAVPPPLSVRFLFLEEEFGAYYFRAGEAYQKIGDTPYVISGPQDVAAGESIRLYKDYPDPTSGTPIRTEILSVKPPPAAVSALVVVTARPSTPAQSSHPVYHATFYNSDVAAFPAGSLRVINLGRVELAAKFGSNQFTLSPAKLQVVKPSFDSRHRVRTYIGTAQPGGGWQLVYDSITSLRPNQRMTGVLVYSPTGMRHTYRPEDLVGMPAPEPGHFWLTYSDNPSPPIPTGQP